jgi:hypothetical protein
MLGVGGTASSAAVAAGLGSLEESRLRVLDVTDTGTRQGMEDRSEHAEK